MKEFLITISMAGLACLGLTGCGDDPVIVDAGTSGETEIGIDGNPTGSQGSEPGEGEGPALPDFLLAEPYAQYFNRHRLLGKEGIFLSRVQDMNSH